MKHLSFSTSLLVVVAVLSFSCSSYQSITIENQLAPKIVIPSSIQSITLLNRSISPEFRNFNEDSLQLYFYRNGFQMRTNVLDSLASDTCLQALGNLLYESGRFDIVIPVERNIPRQSKFYRVEAPLSQDTVKQICDQFQTDALLVMERMITCVNTSLSGAVNEIMPGGAVDISYYTATIDLVYNAFFRLYDPKKNELAGQFFISDSIFWSEDHSNQQVLFERLRSIKGSLIDAGIKIALDLDDKISPPWEKQTRGFFVFDKKDTLEQRLIANNNWDKLAETWEDKTNTTSKKIKSRAEHNMALVAELDGEIDQSIIWLRKSLLTQYSNQADIYLQQLIRRKKEIEKLSKRMATDPVKKEEKGYLQY